MRRILAVLGIAGIVLACGVAVVFFAGVSIARNVRVTGSEVGVTRVETPFGALRVKTRDRLDLKGLGIPIYPGARRLEDSPKQASLELEVGQTYKSLTAAAAEFETDAPIDEVERYYRDR